MTNELEKQFFDAFGIEPKLTLYNLIKVKGNGVNEYSTWCSANYNNEAKEETIRRHSSNGWKVIKCEDIYTYPQITDRILLELICMTKGLVITENCNSVKQLKDGVLKVLIGFAQVNKDIKHQVRTLFEEG